MNLIEPSARPVDRASCIVMNFTGGFCSLCTESGHGEQVRGCISHNGPPCPANNCRTTTAGLFVHREWIRNHEHFGTNLKSLSRTTNAGISRFRRSLRIARQAFRCRSHAGRVRLRYGGGCPHRSGPNNGRYSGRARDRMANAPRSAARLARPIRNPMLARLPCPAPAP